MLSLSRSKGNLYIPTSTNDAWLEAKSNSSALANLSSTWQDVIWPGKGHFHSAINTDLDFVLGNEWIIDAGQMEYLK